MYYFRPGKEDDLDSLYLLARLSLHQLTLATAIANGCSHNDEEKAILATKT